MKLTITLTTIAAALLLVVAAPAQSLSSQPQAYATLARTPLAATL